MVLVGLVSLEASLLGFQMAIPGPYPVSYPVVFAKCKHVPGVFFSSSYKESSQIELRSALIASFLTCMRVC